MRTILRELETHLFPAAAGPSPKASGKIERKTYGDGTERLKVKVRKLDVPDGRTATVTAGNVVLCEMEVTRGRGEFDREEPAGGALPKLAAGQLVEVRVGEDVHLRGELCVD